MDEITNRCAGLRLSAKESAEVEIQTSEMEAGPILVGKFYTRRWVNLESVARVLRIAWKTKEDFEVSCCEILKYSQVYEPYQSIVGQE